jgi:hypothetical protein
MIEQYSLWPSNRTYSFFTKYPWLWSLIYKTTKQTHTLAKENKDFHQANRSPPAAGVEGGGGGGAPKKKSKISTELAEAAQQYAAVPESSVAKYLFDPAVSLEPYILEGFIRCIQEVPLAPPLSRPPREAKTPFFACCKGSSAGNGRKRRRRLLSAPLQT